MNYPGKILRLHLVLEISKPNPKKNLHKELFQLITIEIMLVFCR
jgi:hypothetical protein